MSYTRNFGMRSFENAVRDGRFKTPATGSPIVIGAPVMIDTANPGFLTLATDSVNPTPGCGILVYEHIQFQGVDTFLTSPQDPPFNVAPLGRYAQMLHGAGVKVWFKNTADKPLYDGRVQAGATLVAGLGATPTLAVGDWLTPAGDGTWKEGTATNGWLYVEQVSAAAGLVEARFRF